MKKSLLLYGFLMAVLIMVMKSIEYRYLIRKIDVDIYIGLVAVVFMGLGLWIGSVILKRQSLKTKNIASGETAQSLDISEREMDVLVLMADGLSNQEIADKLFISIHTVKTHSSNLFSKLHAKRRTQAIQKAKEIGLIQG